MSDAVPFPAVVTTAGIVGLGLVGIDRLQLAKPLAATFGPLSAVEHVAVAGVAAAVIVAALVAVDTTAWVLGRAGRRDAPAIGSGVALGLYAALSLEPLVNALLGAGLFGTALAGRLIWGGITAALCVVAVRFVTRARREDVTVSAVPAVVTAAGVAIGAIGYVALALTAASPPARPAPHAGPNVLIVVFDGVRAERTTPYGATRPTTPHLAALAARGVVADDAMPNACQTYGSVPSLLSGRSAVSQHLTYWPDRLVGRDAYSHLPDQLGRAGYRTAVIGAPDYIDPVDLGARGDIDLVNHGGGPLELPGLDHDTRAVVVAGRMWAVDLVARIAPFGLHLLGVRTISSFDDTYVRATGFDDDAWRVARARAHIDAADPRPWFAYVHLLGTHGPFYTPHHRQFALPDNNKPWDADLADDALVEVDAHLGALVALVEHRGEADNTLIVVVSDHQEEWTCGRVPFVAKFPADGHVGRIAGPVSLLDVAPTVLGAVGMPIPADWEGIDLGAQTPARDRGVWMTWLIDPITGGPMGHGLTSIGWQRCDTVWVVPVDGGPVTRVPIAGFRGDCSGLPPVNDADVARDGRDRLAAWGWSIAP